MLGRILTIQLTLKQKETIMRNNKVKSFTFKVAKKAEANETPWKADEGVAVAGGCTMTRTFWGGREPMCEPGNPDVRDGSVFC